MKQTLKNATMTVSAKADGAELCSIQGADGTEYLWQADPAIWGQHSPILFPIVGNLANDRYTIKDETFSLPQHGFAQQQRFRLEEQTENALVYRLDDTAETRRDYPFGFSLRVHYVLNGNTLTVRYTVQNKSAEVMPFSIGAHPGFALNWGPDDAIEDYGLQFNHDEPLETHYLGADRLLSGETTRIPTTHGMLPLSKSLFDRDALIFWGLKSDTITLQSHKHDKQLTVRFPGFPHLGIWAKPAAPYVCIEPWYGHADLTGTDGRMLHKAGIIKLEAGGTFSCAFTITIDEHTHP
jgi:galactose mutarotase-like enzyme